MTRRPLAIAATVIALPVLGLATWIGISTLLTEREIAGRVASVRQIAEDYGPVAVKADAFAELPAPVQRYLRFAVPELSSPYHFVHVAERGDFRRPLMEAFEPTRASQNIAVATPALMFDATTPMMTVLWARPYDYFAEGKMVMRAKIASTLTVVDERESEVLNRISLRRWLLESPLFPMALLPGGPVSWEAVDAHHARATVSGFGLEASMVAQFREDGSLESFLAEEDGDLNTPYHGSGEYSWRGDYREVQGMMIPHSFITARAAGGETFPFWQGEVTEIAFE
ncbi:DUF6920 family protein [Salipiger abyssi]|uniref:DUF6920 family protein n=1 Tax=Salipiger abyssi TaxID=1250539 RepID=UPI001A8DE05F|nr:DUF6544 family protein [Salipiger abyssi]MBN9888635.1 hypothetical protein [Salipiger abyssi]